MMLLSLQVTACSIQIDLSMHSARQGTRLIRVVVSTMVHKAVFALSIMAHGDFTITMATQPNGSTSLADLAVAQHTRDSIVGGTRGSGRMRLEPLGRSQVDNISRAFARGHGTCNIEVVGGAMGSNS